MRPRGASWRASRASGWSQPDDFDRDRGGLATADALRSDAASQPARAQRMHQRRDQARARRADRMTERAGAAVDVDPCRASRPRSCIATIVTQANASLISNRSTSPSVQPARSSALRIDGAGAVVNHSGACAWLAYATMRASGCRPRSPRQPPSLASTMAARAVRDRRGRGGRDRAVLAERRLERRDLRRCRSRRASSSWATCCLALARRDRDRRDLRAESRLLDRALRAAHGLGREGVLVVARVAVLRGGRVGEATHRLAVPRALQSVVEHVIEDLAVAHAITRARLRAAGTARSTSTRGRRPVPIARVPARIWSAASITAFMPEPHILLTVVAGMLERNTGSERRLACRGLAEAGRHHAAEDHLVDPPRARGRRRRALPGRPRRPARCALTGAQHALEGADRRASGGSDDECCAVIWVFLVRNVSHCKPGSRRTLAAATRHAIWSRVAGAVYDAVFLRRNRGMYPVPARPLPWLAAGSCGRRAGRFAGCDSWDQALFEQLHKASATAAAECDWPGRYQCAIQLSAPAIANAVELGIAGLDRAVLDAGTDQPADALVDLGLERLMCRPVSGPRS